MPDKTPTLLHTCELRPATIRMNNTISGTPRVHKSNRIYGVFSIGVDEGESEDAKGDEQPDYYIDTYATFTFPIWPFSSTQVVASYSNPPTSSEISRFARSSDIYKRKAEPFLRVTQMHSLMGRFMCTVGGIHQRTPTADEASKVGNCDNMFLSTGLGHGSWSDAELERKLGLKKGCLNWHAGDREWEWPGQDGMKVEGGSLILRGKREHVLAVYKPRCAVWKKEEKDGECDDGKGIGVLGVCDEILLGEGKEKLVSRVMLSAVAIEEQIMGSKGFQGKLYHAGWMN